MGVRLFLSVVRSTVIPAACLSAVACANVKTGQSVDAATNHDVADRAPALPPPNAPPPAVNAPDLACGAAVSGNAGCSFFGVGPPLGDTGLGGCYAMFVVNPGSRPAKLTVTQGGTSYRLDSIARTPRGTGPDLKYEPFDPAVGLLPGGVAVVFLVGKSIDPATATPGKPATGCPDGIVSAVPDGTASARSNRGMAFHLSSDRPVVAYDMNPFNHAGSAVTSASLLIPEEAWSRNNIAATPWRDSLSGPGSPVENISPASATYVTIIASRDGTEVSVRPTSVVEATAGVPGGTAGQTLRLSLNAGQFAQLSEALVRSEDSPALSGTVVSANHPVLTIGGMPCQIIGGINACDSSHQQIPPLSAWGHEYAAVGYRSRTVRPEPVPWLFVGAVDGTVLTYAPKSPAPLDLGPLGTPEPPAPVALAAGQVVLLWTREPFVVRSQDASHPFYLAAQMTCGESGESDRIRANYGAGDPDFVNAIPLEQYLNDYTFFTDPTYSETNLVLVRRPNSNGAFADVKLGCAATPVTGWIDLGGVQFARVDLVTGRFKPTVPGCSTGVNRISSTAPFGLTVWGWGTNIEPSFPGERPLNLGYTSYGYPAGAGLSIVNVIVP